MLAGLRRAARRPETLVCRLISVGDSQVAVCAFDKGRGGWELFGLSRRAAALLRGAREVVSTVGEVAGDDRRRRGALRLAVPTRRHRVGASLRDAQAARRGGNGAEDDSFMIRLIQTSISPLLLSHTAVAQKRDARVLAGGGPNGPASHTREKITSSGVSR